MKGQNFKDFESQVRTPENHEEFNAIREKLGTYGIQPQDMIAIVDGVKPCKYLSTYLIFKCREIFSKNLSAIYYSQALGYVIGMKEYGCYFVVKAKVDALRLLALDDSKQFYSMIS